LFIRKHLQPKFRVLSAGFHSGIVKTAEYHAHPKLPIESASIMATSTPTGAHPCPFGGSWETPAGAAQALSASRMKEMEGLR
jgi:hypothetical protein